MQHNVVLSNGESLISPGEEELYEFDVQECLMRLRWGQILSLTQERLGLVVCPICSCVGYMLEDRIDMVFRR